ncbi:RagB/SusD family nutrient uptake outer membrane protein [Polaribacter sp.]|uniref:RagB/SusD family nutrient uptake outer membrane protein n=1 Tax=Polaribacter sp. TaxID=1920175 RepID=UPI003EF1D950
MKFIKYIMLLLIVSFATSCSDFLEPAPSSAITSQNYYTTIAELESALIGVYDAIQGDGSYDKDENHGIQYEFYITEMRSGNTSTKIADTDDFSDAGQFESFNVLPTNGFVANYYSSFFQIIYRANVVLENLGNVDGNTTAIEAEAKFLRGYAYFNLVRLFGDLPLIDHVLTASETDIQFTRVDKSSVYDLIVSDLLTAVSGLDNTYKTRASKAAAQGLLAKVYLTLESPNYTQAQLLCEEIINSKQFGLPNFNDVFYSELNEEIIFAIGFQSGIVSDSQNFSAQFMNAVGRSSGVNYATYDLVAAVDASGGDRTQYTYRKDPKHLTSDRYQCAKYFPDGDDGGPSGDVGGTPELAGNDWIVLRYADVLLMHTEAIMGTATNTTNVNALTSFNKVRLRAGLVDDDDVTKDELLLERRVELAFENHRLFDLVRLNKASEILSAYSSANGFGFSSTDLLLPIPQNEVNLSNGLMKQNPGY